MVIRTEVCNFSEQKIYPGKGIKKITRDGNYLQFSSHKTHQFMKKKRKGQNIRWTVIWRKINKKIIIEKKNQKKKKKQTEVVKGISGITKEELEKRMKMTTQDLLAQREKVRLEIKKQQKKVDKKPKQNPKKKKIKPGSQRPPLMKRTKKINKFSNRLLQSDIKALTNINLKCYYQKPSLVKDMKNLLKFKKLLYNPLQKEKIQLLRLNQDKERQQHFQQESYRTQMKILKITKPLQQDQPESQQYKYMKKSLDQQNYLILKSLCLLEELQQCKTWQLYKTNVKSLQEHQERSRIFLVENKQIIKLLKCQLLMKLMSFFLWVLQMIQILQLALLVLILKCVSSQQLILRSSLPQQRNHQTILLEFMLKKKILLQKELTSIIFLQRKMKIKQSLYKTFLKQHRLVSALFTSIPKPDVNKSVSNSLKITFLYNIFMVNLIMTKEKKSWKSSEMDKSRFCLLLIYQLEELMYKLVVW